MNCTSIHRFCRGVILAFAAAFLAACAVSLAPSYQIVKESIAVRYLPDAPPYLAVRAEYRLANLGTAPLSSIEVGLPGRRSFGRRNLRVELDGRKVTPEFERGEEAQEGESAASETWPTVCRIPFSPAWPRKQKRGLLIEYDLAPQNTEDLRIFVGSRAFHLNDSGWFPDLLTPPNPFATDVVRPNPSELLVDVPPDFRVTASGETRGAEKRASELIYRFRLRGGDFDPYVVAGEYQQQTVTTPDGLVVLWSFVPQPPAQAWKAAHEIAATRRVFEATFGPLPKNVKAIWDVESAPQPSAARNLRKLNLQPVLPGVVLDWFSSPRRPWWTPRGSAHSTAFGQFELADTWFSHLITPRPEAWLLPDALAFYASDLLQQGESRNRQVADLLQDYDEDRKQAVEKPVMSLLPSDPEEQIKIGAVKAELFLFALEDRCGRDNLDHALAHMIYALRGHDYGYEDFRSALEQECRAKLGQSFRTWLNQTGIPPEFRARYSANKESKKMNQGGTLERSHFN